MKLVVNTTFDRKETLVESKDTVQALQSHLPTHPWAGASIGPDNAPGQESRGCKSQPCTFRKRNCYQVLEQVLKNYILMADLQPNFYKYRKKGLVLKRSRSHFNLATGIRFPCYREHCPLISGFQPQLIDV